MRFLSGFHIYKLLFLILCLHGNSQEIQFNKLVINGVKFTGNVLTIHQDRHGYIWLGTEDGLLKYDGTKLTNYRNERNNKNSLSDNYITSIAEDSKGKLWIGTQKNLSRYNPITESFENFNLNVNNIGGFSGNNIILLSSDSKGLMWVSAEDLLYSYNPTTEIFTRVNRPSNIAGELIQNIGSIYEDITGEIWYGTTKGLYIYNPITNKTRLITFEEPTKKKLGLNYLNCFQSDSSHNVWIGTFGGIIVYNRNTKQYKTFRIKPENPNYLSINQIRDISIDRNNKVWVCTNYGLYCCDPCNIKDELHYNSLYNIVNNDESISSNSTTSAFQDKDGRIWITSRFGGVDIYDPGRKAFEVFRHNHAQNNSLSHNNISSFAEDSHGNIWIATDEGGINCFDTTKKTFTRIYNQLGNPNSISNNKVLSLCIDNENILWIGYWGGGVDRYDIKRNKFTHYRSIADDESTIASDYIFYIMQDSRKNIWICHWSAGITLFDYQTKKFIRIPKKQQKYTGLANNTVTVAFEDNLGTIWLGTENYGMFSYLYKNDSLVHYAHDLNNPFSISHNTINSFCEDKLGRLWIGTMGNGINLMDRKTGKFIYFTKDEGLSDNAICGIVEDSEGNLWLSTHQGITKFNYNSNDKDQPIKTRNYNYSDGLQSNNFNRWAFYKSSTGYIYFGGSNGFNRFKPENISDNLKVPDIKITGIYIFKEKYTNNISLGKPIDKLKEIELMYNQSMITFEFSALNYTDPIKNQYKCKLEGFDTEWRNNGSYNRATYTNLDPGEYIFRVKASNNDGIWNEKGISIKIKIIPPSWKSWWFIAICLLIIIILGYYLLKKREKKLKVELDKQKEIEALLKTAKDKAEESDQLKTTILANLSHEIRTPLNGLIGFIELVIRPNVTIEKRDKYVYIIKNRASDLLQIIDSLLNISSLVSNTSLALYDKVSSEEIIEAVVKKATRKIRENIRNIEIEVKKPKKPDVIFYTDPHKLEVILWHITDNAIKFSDNGSITIGYEYKDCSIEFFIKDQGIGINPEMQKIIYEPFRQSELGFSRKYGGLGLGLALCKGFADLIDVKLSYKTEIGKGTTFYIIVPIKTEI